MQAQISRNISRTNDIAHGLIVDAINFTQGDDVQIDVWVFEDNVVKAFPTNNLTPIIDITQAKTNHYIYLTGTVVNATSGHFRVNIPSANSAIPHTPVPHRPQYASSIIVYENYGSATQRQVTIDRSQVAVFWSPDFNDAIVDAVATTQNTFIGHVDTPASYAGQELNVLRVNADGDAVEFFTLVGGGDMLFSVYDTDTNNIVDAAESVPWSGITSRPSGLDDGDDDTTYTAGPGLTLSGFAFEINAGNVTANWDNVTNKPPNLDIDSTDDFSGSWNDLSDIPAGFADDTDDGTAYTAGPGLTLVGAAFEINAGNVTANWDNVTNKPPNLDTDSTDDFDGAFGSLSGVPAGLSDGDDDTTYTAGPGLTLSGFAFEINAGNVTANWDNVTNKPPNLDIDSTDDFSGSWNDLTDIPAGFADNTDDEGSGGGGTGAVVYVTNTVDVLEIDPSAPGDFLLLTDSNALFQSTDGSSSTWYLVNAPSVAGGGASSNQFPLFVVTTNMGANASFDFSYSEGLYYQVPAVTSTVATGVDSTNYAAYSAITIYASTNSFTWDTNVFYFLEGSLPTLVPDEFNTLIMRAHRGRVWVGKGMATP